MVVKGIEKYAAERDIRLIDEAVVKKSREEMIEKRGAMFPFLKKFINSEKLWYLTPAFTPPRGKARGPQTTIFWDPKHYIDSS